MLLEDYQFFKRLTCSGLFYRLKGRWPELQTELVRLKEERVKMETSRDAEVIQNIKEKLSGVGE